jgi:hypothetical protein
MPVGTALTEVTTDTREHLFILVSDVAVPRDQFAVVDDPPPLIGLTGSESALLESPRVPALERVGRHGCGTARAEHGRKEKKRTST